MGCNSGDLKSLNILVAHDWHYKIADFGISRVKKVSVYTILIP